MFNVRLRIRHLYYVQLSHYINGDSRFHHICKSSVSILLVLTLTYKSQPTLFANHLCQRRSGQSAYHGSASDCCFPLMLLPDASVTCSPTISDKRRFEVTGTSVYTLSVGLLQCFAGRNNWHSIKTAAISREYCGPFSVWSTTAGPHHSSPT